MSELDTEDRNALSTDKFAFPKERKEPLENASHVRNAIARFNQVQGVSESEKDAAWKRITAAAKKFGVDVSEGSRKELKGAPRKAGAKKASATKKAAKKAPAKKAASKKAAKKS